MLDDQTMTHLDLTDGILRQGKALVRAIEALGTIDPSGPVERAAAGGVQAQAAGRRGGCARLVTEEIPSASERVGDRRAVLYND